jgi:RHS repeat-associated protein
MPVCGQEFLGSTLRITRVNFLSARGIEAVVTVDHTRGNQVALRWLLYDGHGNLVRRMASDYTLSAFQWRGVWGEVQGSLGAGRGYCANLGHPEDETGLVYMRARYYEPATGRFISEDPARDGVNWYLYADGNPVNKVDSKGQSAESEWYAVGVAATAIAVIYAMLIPAARGILEVYKAGRFATPLGSMANQFVATLTAIVGGVLTAMFAVIAIYSFMRALGGLQTEIKAIISMSSGWIAARTLALYQDSLHGLSKLGQFAGGVGLTAAIAAGSYMGMTTAALLLIDAY